MTHYRAFVRSGYHAVETICRVLICIWPERKRTEEKKWIHCMELYAAYTCLRIGSVATTENNAGIKRDSSLSSHLTFTLFT